MSNDSEVYVKIGFQHMANLDIALKAFVGNLGCDVVLGPKPNKKTLDIGVRHAPELVCLPFKVTLGIMFQNLENGADTLAFIGGGDWSCRYGYYGRVQCLILKKLGYEFNSIFVNDINVKSLVSEILKLNHNSWTITLKRALRAFALAWHKSKSVDFTEELARTTRAFEINKGNSSRLTRKFVNRIDKEGSITKIRHMKEEIKEEFRAIEQDSSFEPLKILIVGESYCVIEPFVNFDLIEYLGNHNVLALPFYTAHRWLFYHSMRIDEDKNCSKKKAVELAQPIWAYGTGGEDQVSIGYVLNAIHQGYDGFIHLMPFGCMPETAALPVFERLSKEYNMPFLNISLDEHTSPTGLHTRLEAFLDLLAQRRKKIFDRGRFAS